MGRKITTPDPEVGSTFGNWTITGPSQSIEGERMIEVTCICGTTGFKLRANIIAGKSSSCGCVNRVATPNAGETVGEWTVLERIDSNFALVECSCGKIARRYVYTLGKDSVSCGHPVASGFMTKYGKSSRARGNHGRERSKLKRTYGLMLERCSDLTTSTYGGKGVRVCEEWLEDIDAFITWAIDNGYKAGQRLQLDRIDSTGNYEASNCRWVTPTENTRNRSNTRKATAWGETKPVAAWAEDSRCQVSYGLILSRLDRGVDAAVAISTPAHNL